MLPRPAAPITPNVRVLASLIFLFGLLGATATALRGSTLTGAAYFTNRSHTLVTFELAIGGSTPLPVNDQKTTFADKDATGEEY